MVEDMDGVDMIDPNTRALQEVMTDALIHVGMPLSALKTMMRAGHRLSSDFQL